MEKSIVQGTWQQRLSFSPAVTTKGGRTVWLAGHTGETNDNGQSLAGDFDEQTRQVFRNLETTMRTASGSVKDIVTMTVFLLDAKHVGRMAEIRHEILGGDFASSAAIVVAGLVSPDMLIEIQAIAVLPE